MSQKVRFTYLRKGQHDEMVRKKKIDNGGVIHSIWQGEVGGFDGVSGFRQASSVGL